MPLLEVGHEPKVSSTTIPDVRLPKDSQPLILMVMAHMWLELLLARGRHSNLAFVALRMT